MRETQKGNSPTNPYPRDHRHIDKDLFEDLRSFSSSNQFKFLPSIPGWLEDGTVIYTRERNIFYKNDQIMTDDYVIRVKPNGVKILMEELDHQFSQVSRYGNINEQGGMIIEMKTNELANSLLGKRKSLEFTSPSFDLKRFYSKELRDKIRSMSYAEWMKMGWTMRIGATMMNDDLASKDIKKLS